jgi:asparagine synthase (glutamine-hydrolysing)
MSGWVGIVHLDGRPVCPEWVQRLTATMAFRGPDAQMTQVDGAVGFGHTLLRTTWESAAEVQPWRLESHGELHGWIVADARIDGRETLLAQLGLAREAYWRTCPDVELIAQAYDRWGDRCVDYLLGDFAFAIWDARQQRLFCARDPFGAKLLYYSHGDGCLIVSNTLSCIRQHPQVSSRLNDYAIGDFLLFGMNYNLETTTFVDIQRLPPAHTLVASADRGIETRRYWTLPLPEVIRYRHPREYVEHFHELMGQAVGDRLRTEKVAISFSGGLDSTTIAAKALDVAKARSQPLDLRAFTVVYDSTRPDEERHYAGLAAKALQIPIEYQVADAYYPYQGWNHPNFCTPEPAHEPFYAISLDHRKWAATHSRILLSGHGGDEALAHTTVAEMLHTMPLIDVVLDVGRCLRAGVQPNWGSGLWAAVQGRRAPAPNCYPDWLNPEFAQRLSLPDRWHEILVSLSNTPQSPKARAYEKSASVLWASHLEQNDPQFWGLPIETRLPFLDLRLLRYLLALPPLPWCVGKALLRAAMQQTLPSAVVRRPKTPLAGRTTVESFQGAQPNAMESRLRSISAYVHVDQLATPNPWGEGVPSQFPPYAISLAYWIDHNTAARAKPILLPT